ncbi:MAG: DNA repair protein RecO [Planctomycetes bacterium]|nr:DNA repair protein RecO [Planctomycetota bacterium]
MALRNDTAVVLRHSDYSETSQIVTLFTAQTGLVRLIAKGARRGTRQRFAPGIDLLETGTVSFAPARGQAGLGTLAEWVQQDAFLGLRRAAVRLYGGMYAAELVNALTQEHDPHPTLFEALLELLRTLAADGEQSASYPATALVRFQLELLTAIGYAPRLAQCVDCGRPRPRGAAAYFCSTAGGLVCRDCEMHHVEKRRLSAALLDAGPQHVKPREWFALLDYHLTHVAGRPARLAAHLGALLASHDR